MDRLQIYVDFSMPASALDVLQAGVAPHKLVFPAKPASSVLAKPEFDPVFNTADIAFGQPDPERILGSDRLKWVHISSSGITRYDTRDFRDRMSRRGIPLTNSAGVYAEACAAHALSFMLAQARMLPAGLKTRTPNGSEIWHALRSSSSSLRGETALIVGYGAIGRRLAELLAPFDMTIVAYRRKARGDENVPIIEEAKLAEHLSSADHVINILPDSASTGGFFHRARFSLFKPGATFYNIGRGTTVDQNALFAALRSNQLKAAWLDVTDPEPLPNAHPLLSEPRCHITPHTAGGHAGEATTLVRHFLKNLERFATGRPLVDRVM